jgi:serine/threonine protein phosphatase 1
VSILNRDTDSFLQKSDMTLSAWLGKFRKPAAAPRGQPANEVAYSPDLAGLRLAAIGDIHGRVDLLAELHGRLDLETRKSRRPAPIEVYLGDYIDRGPQSRQVIEALMARQRERQVVCLMGNHERMLLRAFDDPGAVMEWLHYGGEDTLRSYGLGAGDLRGAAERDPSLICRVMRELIPRDHLVFLSRLALRFAIGGFAFAHAGIRPGVPLRDQREQDLLWIREGFLDSKADHGFVVVHGHTPVRGPEFLQNRINLDTGAVYTGQLTCLLISDEELSFV